MSATQATLLREISRVISSARHYHDGLTQVLGAILRSQRATAGALFLADEDAGRLRLAAVAGRVATGLSADLALPAGAGLTGRVLQSMAPLAVARPEKDARFDPRDTRWALRVHSLLLLPLRVAGRCVGVLALARERPPAFGRGRAAALDVLLPPVAVYVLHARLARSEAAPVVAGTAPPLGGAHLLKGKAVSPGLAQGKAYLLEERDVFDPLPVEYAPDRARERALLERALTEARRETRALQRQVSGILAEADVSIFYAHLLLLDDPLLLDRLHAALDKGFSLRFSLKTVMESFRADLLRLDSELMRERVADIKDVILRIADAAHRGGRPRRTNRARAARTPPAQERIVVVARELLPSQLIRLPLKALVGILCEGGGATSHVAILAKSLHLPMVVDIRGITQLCQREDDIILDGATGSVYLRPGPEVRRSFAPALKYRARRRRTRPWPQPATRDGVPVRIGGNISLISELPLLAQYGAQGIGLYRTEFMFMVRAACPTEEEQYQVYRRVVEGCPGASVTVRVLDVGGDKALPYVDFGQESNPFLGWRGLRFLLSNRQYMDPHLRAMLRATVHGRVNILLPMVADIEELLEAKAVLADARRDLDRRGIRTDVHHLGVMLEVPSAVANLPALLPHVDFLSIGTNDLVQYMFAVDRANARVSRWFRQMHPLVFQVLHDICRVAATRNVPVSICGEMAGLAPAIPLLLGAGLRFLSMNPWQIPAARSLLARVTVPECEALFRQAVACTATRDVESLAAAFLRTHQGAARGARGTRATGPAAP
jgi:phosphotransferase system enzyme I (PtsP)